MRRGDVYALPPPRRRVGHEQRGRRYAVIVQSAIIGPTSTVVIVPTSASAGEAMHRPTIAVRGRGTRALTEQVAGVDRERLGRFLGRLDDADLAEVDDALRLVLGLL